MYKSIVGAFALLFVAGCMSSPYDTQETNYQYNSINIEGYTYTPNKLVRICVAKPSVGTENPYIYTRIKCQDATFSSSNPTTWDGLTGYKFIRTVSASGYTVCTGYVGQAATLVWAQEENSDGSWNNLVTFKQQVSSCWYGDGNENWYDFVDNCSADHYPALIFVNQSSCP